MAVLISLTEKMEASLCGRDLEASYLSSIQSSLVTIGRDLQTKGSQHGYISRNQYSSGLVKLIIEDPSPGGIPVRIKRAAMGRAVRAIDELYHKVSTPRGGPREFAAYFSDHDRRLGKFFVMFSDVIETGSDASTS